MKKNTKCHEKLKWGISHQSSYKQARRQAKKLLLLLKQKQNNINDSHIIIGMKEGEE